MSESQPSAPFDSRVRVHVPGDHLMGDLLGTRDEFLEVIEGAFPSTRITVRGNDVAIDGSEASTVGVLFGELVSLLEQGHRLSPSVLDRTIDMVRANERPSEVLTAEVMRTSRGTRVRPKTAGQKRYV